MALDTSSIDALRNATVYSSDGDKIGKVGDVYLGDHSEQPEWVTVKTGLFGTAETFVPLAEANLHGDELRVPYAKDKVKDAPRTEADGQISEAEEDRLFTYYGVSDSSTSPAGTTGTSGTTSTTGTSGTSGAGYTEGSGQDREDYEGLDDRGARAGLAGVAGAGVGGLGATGGSDARHRGETSDLPYDQSGDRTSDQTGDRTADQRRDLAGQAGVQGHDTSGPTTDDAMTRSEERLHVGTERREAGRARLRKHIVTETQTAQVATSHEELTIEREPITEANRGAATSGAQLSEEEHEVILHEEVPVVSKTVEAVERVRLGTETEHDTQAVSADVRKEEIELDTDGVTDRSTGHGDRTTDRTTGRDDRI